METTTSAPTPAAPPPIIAAFSPPKKTKRKRKLVIFVVIGVGLGIAGGNVLALVLKLAPVIPMDWVVLGLVICSVVGIIFGTYPAFKAANLDPIESLRYE